MGILDKLFGRSKESRVREVDRMPFRMPIQEVRASPEPGTFYRVVVHSILPKHGSIVMGVVERGSVSVGDWLEIVGGSRPPIKARLLGIVKDSTIVEEARTGDRIGCLLQGVKETEIMPGQELTKPGTVGS